MGFELTKKQKLILSEIDTFSRDSKQVYEYGGLAGTGKSFIMPLILEKFKLQVHEVAAMAFIGSAAIVMRLKGMRNAKTIHSWLLEPTEIIKVDAQGKVVMDPYLNKPIYETVFLPTDLPHDIKLIIVDEGGTVPKWLKPIIESRGVKVIVTGDPGQLPSVMDEPAYLVNPDNYITMDEIMRQNEANPLLYLANRARFDLPIHNGWYNGVLVVDKSEITDKMVLGSDVVLCPTNKTRDAINHRIRHEILGIKTNIPVYGERLICRKNNWNIAVDGINLANGLNGYVTNSPDVSNFDGRTFKINFKPSLIDNQFIDLLVDYEYLTSNHEQRRRLKSSPYSVGEKFEYGYSSTVHLSQGSEYNNGLYIDEYLNRDIQNRLRYTAITRFRHGMIYANISKKYF